MSTTATAALRVQGVAASATRHVPVTSRPLAPPPPGSGLEPVLGDAGLPLIGRSFEILFDGLTLVRQQYDRFGPVSWMNAFGMKTVLILGPDAIEEVLTNRDRAFANKEGWEYLIGPFFHRGVMLMDFEEHRHHRRIMQQGFKNERLVGYLAGMNPAITRGLDRWVPGSEFPMYTKTKKLTLDLATEVFVGDELGDGADAINKAFVNAVVGGAAFIRAEVPGGRWARGLRGRRLLERYFRERIAAKRASDGNDLFSVLCHAESEDGERFSDDDVVNHMIFVLMAAHDTSTITLAMMAYYLGRGRVGIEYQERLREEARALDKPALDYEDLETRTEMDMAMKETLRIHAPVGSVARRALKDTSVQGKFVPAGSQMLVGLFSSMRIEEWWHDPDVFDPERFSADRREDLSHKYAWMPFGGNVHKCIGMHFGGMEVKAILHQMLLRFAWTVPDGYFPPLGLGTGPTPIDGLPISLRRL